MNAQALLDLAGRCEQASGEDTTLDHEIRVAVWPEKWAAQVAALKAGVLGPRLTEADYPGYLVAKPFTASLDAAMSLVPEGMQWEAGFTRFTPHSAKVWLGNGRGYVDGNSDHSRPLAITAAALKARAASVDTHPKGGNSPKSEVPFMSGAVGEAETPNPSIEHSGNTGEGK